MDMTRTANIKLRAKRILAFVGVVFLVVLLISGDLSALTAEDRKRLFTPFYDPYVEPLCGEGSTPQLEGGTNEEQIWNYLGGKGLTPPQVAGIMGNLRVESGANFNPRIVEPGWGFPAEMDTIPPPTGPDGQPGYGIAQWTSPGRKDGLQAKANELNTDPNNPVGPGDLIVQLEWLWQELTQNYTGTYDQIVASQDERHVSDVFGREYEGFGTNTETLRGDYAEDILTRLGGGTPGSDPERVEECDNPTEVAGDCADVNGPVGSNAITVVTVGEAHISPGGVHNCLVAQVQALLEAALADDLTLTGSAWRDPEQQIALRRAHCGDSDYAIYEMPSGQCSPPTARPGQSRHERGLAIDFNNCSSHGTACWQWLNANAARFGLQPFSREPWHWSVDGH